jgi:hypothetical protein
MQVLTVLGAARMNIVRRQAGVDVRDRLDIVWLQRVFRVIAHKLNC